jgi:hypothetical protein
VCDVDDLLKGTGTTVEAVVTVHVRAIATEVYNLKFGAGA